VLEMQMMSCGWHTYVAVLNRLMEPQHSNLEFWISNCNTHIGKFVQPTVKRTSSFIKQWPMMTAMMFIE
jgi:hypothetical protein